MKVYITKYALTQGIFEIDAEICESISPDMIKNIAPGRYDCYHGKGNNWHTDKNKAIIAAENMRKNKIKNLQKQISKLEQLTFSYEK